MIAGCYLAALCATLLLCLPAGGATVISAQGIGAWLAGSLRYSAQLRATLLLSLRYCLTVLMLLRMGPCHGLRFGIVTPVVIALGNLL